MNILSIHGNKGGSLAATIMKTEDYYVLSKEYRDVKLPFL
jgi:hypothetical protein